MQAAPRRLADVLRAVWRLARTAAHAEPRGQAIVETALVVPVLLLLAVGVVGVARVGHAQMAVGAVAREAARAGALANTRGQAIEAGTIRGREVASGYGLATQSLEVSVDPGAFERSGRVRASARYEVAFDNLPLLSWTRVGVAGEHVERIDPYRSRVGGGTR